jgi:hypothetical protein
MSCSRRIKNNPDNLHFKNPYNINRNLVSYSPDQFDQECPGVRSKIETSCGQESKGDKWRANYSDCCKTVCDTTSCKSCLSCDDLPRPTPPNGGSSGSDGIQVFKKCTDGITPGKCAATDSGNRCCVNGCKGDENCLNDCRNKFQNFCDGACTSDSDCNTDETCIGLKCIKSGGNGGGGGDGGGDGGILWTTQDKVDFISTLTNKDNNVPKDNAICILNNIMIKYTPYQFSHLDNSSTEFLTNLSKSCMANINYCISDSACTDGKNCIKNGCVKSSKPDKSPPNNSGLSTGAIIGIVLSSCAILILIWYFATRYKRTKGGGSSISSY